MLQNIIGCQIGKYGRRCHIRCYSSETSRNFFEKTALKAVVGATADKDKFGNKVLRCYVQHKYPVVAINSKYNSIEDTTSFPSLTELEAYLIKQRTVEIANVGVSIVTPPSVSKRILEEALNLGIRYYFLQPGTCDSVVDGFIQTHMKQCIVVKSCVLVELGCSHL